MNQEERLQKLPGWIKKIMVFLKTNSAAGNN